MITGVDLIQEQIRVAQGEKLRYTQQDITFKVTAGVLARGAGTSCFVCKRV
jgi:acetyl/propionyl-CoA carboxylase alpha subunit